MSFPVKYVLVFPSLLRSVDFYPIFRAPLPSSRVFKLTDASLRNHLSFVGDCCLLASHASFLCAFRIHKIIPCPSLPHCRAFVLIHPLFRNVPELFVRPHGHHLLHIISTSDTVTSNLGTSSRCDVGAVSFQCGRHSFSSGQNTCVEQDVHTLVDEVWQLDGVVVLGALLGNAQFAAEKFRAKVEEEWKLWEVMPTVPDLQCGWQILLQTANP